jgi:predicted 3-demethylubiquinone-9 3-methyltransferase (glyoxalase superfamily)
MASIIEQKITPYLWFNNNAKEAASFYCSLFKDSKINSSSAMIIEFQLAGQQFMALNGGPKFKFTEAISLFILCDDQKEVDHFWDAFTQNGGEEGMCGWCKDKYGLSWQVVPKRFIEMMKTGTAAQTAAVMKAMMPMHKMIIEEFEKAFYIA